MKPEHISWNSVVRERYKQSITLQMLTSIPYRVSIVIISRNIRQGGSGALLYNHVKIRLPVYPEWWRNLWTIKRNHLSKTIRYTMIPVFHINMILKPVRLQLILKHSQESKSIFFWNRRCYILCPKWRIWWCKRTSLIEPNLISIPSIVNIISGI